MLLPTILEVHIAVLVEIVAAHGAVELVLGIHLLGGVGDGRRWQVGGKGVGRLAFLGRTF